MAKAQVTVTSGEPERQTVTITNGTALSGIAFVRGRLVGLEMPAAWTAAAITFQGSNDGVNFFDLWDSALTATAVERTIASGNALASRIFPLALGDWIGVNYVKVRSGVSATPVNQGADRIVGLVIAG